MWIFYCCMYLFLSMTGLESEANFVVNSIIAMLEKNGILRVANVGDCGLRLIRKGKLYRIFHGLLIFPIVLWKICNVSFYLFPSFYWPEQIIFATSPRTFFWLSLPVELYYKWSNIPRCYGISFSCQSCEFDHFSCLDFDIETIIISGKAFECFNWIFCTQCLRTLK